MSHLDVPQYYLDTNDMNAKAYQLAKESVKAVLFGVLHSRHN